MKPGEKRRSLRRSVSYPAFLDLGDNAPPRECVLCDASQEGALISVSDPPSLPEEFTLALSIDGSARRRCRIMWRTRDQIGVAFIKAFSIPVRPLAVSHAAPILLSESEAQETEAELVEAPSIVAPAAEQPAEPEPAPSSDLFDIETLTRT
jgi:hypothetical protein